LRISCHPLIIFSNPHPMKLAIFYFVLHFFGDNDVRFPKQGKKLIVDFNTKFHFYYLAGQIFSPIKLTGYDC
jgi:hypothetical protein